MSQTPQVESSDARIRLQAIESLRKIGGAVAISKLATMLIDGDESVRKLARSSLDQIDPNWPQADAARRAIPFLEAALSDDNYWIGLEAAAVLKLISGDVEPAPPAKAESKGEKTTLTDRFFYQKREAARILASGLKDPDADFRLAAAEVLGRLGNVGFADSLAAALQDTDEWVRWHAAQSLHATGWEPPDEKNRAIYMVALRKWDEAEKLGAATVDPLIQSLKSSNGKVREAAATLLGKFKEPRAVMPLADCLQDKQKSVRRAVARALSNIGPQNLTMDQRNLMVEALRS